MTEDQEQEFMFRLFTMGEMSRGGIGVLSFIGTEADLLPRLDAGEFIEFEQGVYAVNLQHIIAIKKDIPLH